MNIFEKDGMIRINVTDEIEVVFDPREPTDQIRMMNGCRHMCLNFPKENLNAVITALQTIKEQIHAE